MQSQVQVSPIPVTSIVLHTKFHLDEAEAVRRLKSYGKKFFPGIENAGVQFTQGLKPKNDATFDANALLPVGCGQARFDEHRADIERLPNECATTLVSKYLGMENNAELKQIADEVLRCDTTKGVKSTELAELIKMAHRQIDSNGLVLGWCMTMLHALHKQLFINADRAVGELALIDLFEKEEKAGRFAHEKARASVRKLVEESMKRKADSITELSFLVECLYRTGAKDIEDQVRFAFDSLYRDQLLFWDAVEECTKARNFEVRALCNFGRKQKEKKIKVLSICSDNPLVQRAARYGEAGGFAVVLLRTKKGNTSVFIDASKGINLVAFTRMVRWLELPKYEGTAMLKSDLPWDSLGQEGELKEVPHWYFFKRAQMLLNGSLTRPDVPPTGISQKSLEEIAMHAFHPGSLAVWMRQRNIIVVAEKKKSLNGVGDAMEQATPNEAPEEPNEDGADSAPKTEEAV